MLQLGHRLARCAARQTSTTTIVIHRHHARTRTPADRSVKLAIKTRTASRQHLVRRVLRVSTLREVRRRVVHVCKAVHHRSKAATCASLPFAHGPRHVPRLYLPPQLQTSAASMTCSFSFHAYLSSPIPAAGRQQGLRARNAQRGCWLNILIAAIESAPHRWTPSNATGPGARFRICLAHCRCPLDDFRSYFLYVIS